MALSGTRSHIAVLLLLLFVCSASAVVGRHEELSSNRRRQYSPPCPEGCACSTQVVRCQGWYPDAKAEKVIPLPKTTNFLTLSEVPVPYIDLKSTLEGLTRLSWLHIQGGALVSPPSFPDLPSLVFVDLSENQIHTLPNKTFQTTPHIVKINLSRNVLKFVHSQAFQGLTNIKEIDLSNNPKLVRLPPDVFASTDSLKFLDLSNIGLRTVEEAWSGPLCELHLLNLSHNSIKSFPNIRLERLSILDLSYNPLLVLPQLKLFPYLTQLIASHSLISSLKVSDTTGCARLQLLDLTYSNLTNLNEHVLSQCKSVRIIDLSYNSGLWRIEHGAFSGLKNLTTLRLDHCPRLYDLEDDVLNGLEGLRELHLQESGVKVLPSSLAQLENLTLLNLEGNSLLCDCYAHRLPDLLTPPKPTWKGVTTINCTDGVNRSVSDIADSLAALKCSEVKLYSPADKWVLTPWGQSALLECNVTGNPAPKIIWKSVDDHLHVYNESVKDHPWVRHEISEALERAGAHSIQKFQVLQSGQLLVQNVIRDDIGRYKCFAFNPVSNISVVAYLGLDDNAFRAMIIESILFGFACATLFLLVTLLVQFIRFVMERLGWECCCCQERLSPKAKQIWQLIESVEAYKTAQLDKLRENYNSQVVNIKDSCYQQMERLRESYAHQSKNLKDLCDYSTQQITGARDQYVDQVNRVRDYSISQMNRVRENYVFQRHRIRKFSGHQLLRLRETYKYQQKTLNKLLETLPDLYIQNCRTGSCQRTDSIIFDDEIAGLDAYYKVDFLDAQSGSSDYYTPNSTLTRQSKGRKTHSRTTSSVSGGTEYQEAHSWITRQESQGSDNSDNQNNRGRSLSIAMPPVISLYRWDSLKGHKRSVSASSHPSPQLFHSTPPLLETTMDDTSPGSISPQKGGSTRKSSGDSNLYTPLSITPVHEPSKCASTRNAAQEQTTGEGSSARESESLIPEGNSSVIPEGKPIKPDEGPVLLPEVKLIKPKENSVMLPEGNPIKPEEGRVLLPEEKPIKPKEGLVMLLEENTIEPEEGIVLLPEGKPVKPEEGPVLLHEDKSVKPEGSTPIIPDEGKRVIREGEMLIIHKVEPVMEEAPQSSDLHNSDCDSVADKMCDNVEESSPSRAVSYETSL